jgi:23S rRNA (pseudouridine1915-N3)-methyltransferase
MIRIVCVGRLKEPHWQAACGEYLKRMRRIEVVELRECTDKNPAVAKRKEAEQIIGKIKGLSVALDQHGTRMTSEALAALMREPELSFVIGGPEGLERSVIASADKTLSLSEMTFPHQLARVMVLEQLYRGQTINDGKSYHK